MEFGGEENCFDDEIPIGQQGDPNAAFFVDIDVNDSQLMMAESLALQANNVTELRSLHRQEAPHDEDQKAMGSTHIFQEMAVVRKRLNFDEQEFRDRCHASSLQISQQFKDIVSELYDVVDALITDLSKVLHRSQLEHYQNLDSRLASIRRQTVEAETVDQSIAKFLAAVQQAYMQSFSSDSKLKE